MEEDIGLGGRRGSSVFYLTLMRKRQSPREVCAK